MKRCVVLALLGCLGASAENADAPEPERLRAAAAGLLSADPETREKSRQEILSAGRAALPVLGEEKKRRADPGEIAALSRVIRILDPEVSEREPVDSIGPFALSPDGKGYVVHEKEDRLVANLGERTPLEAPRQKEPPGILRRDRTVTAKYSTSVDGGAAFATPAASGLNPGELSSVAVCPDGAWVALGCTSDRVQLRLATTWELLAELKTSGPVLDVAFSDDGSTLAAQAPEKLHIFDVRPR